MLLLIQVCAGVEEICLNLSLKVFALFECIAPSGWYCFSPVIIHSVDRLLHLAFPVTKAEPYPAILMRFQLDNYLECSGISQG